MSLKVGSHSLKQMLLTGVVAPDEMPDALESLHSQ